MNSHSESQNKEIYIQCNKAAEETEQTYTKRTKPAIREAISAVLDEIDYVWTVIDRGGYRRLQNPINTTTRYMLEAKTLRYPVELREALPDPATIRTRADAEELEILLIMLDMADTLYYDLLYDLRAYVGVVVDIKMPGLSSTERTAEIDRVLSHQCSPSITRRRRLAEAAVKTGQVISKKILQGAVANRDKADVKRDVTETIEKREKTQTRRQIYTECTMAMNEVGASDEPGRKYRYRIMDADACEICRALDSLTFFYTDRQPGINWPPMHDYCRCWTEDVE